jgi:ATP-dependent Clp protease protease subunit
MSDTQEDFEFIDQAGWGPTDVRYFGPGTKSVCIFGEINRQASLVGISQILDLDSQDKTIPLTVYINTEGGALTDALAIYDCLRSIGSPIITITTGSCASAGLLLLQAGDIRTTTENTLFYYHQPTVPSDDFICVEQIQGTEIAYTFCQKKYDELLLKRSQMKRSVWKNEFSGKLSKYFTADMALEYSLVDEILYNNKKKKIRGK